MDTPKLHLIELIVGDSSGDGHSQTDCYKIESNLDGVSLLKAYKAGAKAAGFSIEKLCKPAETFSIKAKYIKKLIELGLEEWTLLKEDEDNTPIEITAENYVDLWMFTAKLGNPNLEYRRNNDFLRLPIGGYGLYFC
jgi:hypothetical protein